MAEWLYDRDGLACLVLDGNRLCNRHGAAVAWIDQNNVYLQHGEHAGWFQGGVIYDVANAALAFIRDRMGYLPSLPKLIAAPRMPPLAAVSVPPDFAPAPTRPGRGDWSRYTADRYFRPRTEDTKRAGRLGLL